MLQTDKIVIRLLYLATLLVLLVLAGFVGCTVPYAITMWIETGVPIDIADSAQMLLSVFGVMLAVTGTIAGMARLALRTEAWMARDRRKRKKAP